MNALNCHSRVRCNCCVACFDVRELLRSAIPAYSRKLPCVDCFDDPSVALVRALARHPRVVISGRRPEFLLRKLQKFAAGGAAELAVIVDFDRTLTVGRSLSAHGVLGHSPFLDEKFRVTSQGNDAMYLPIEHDPNMTIQEKIPHMQRWYELNHAAMVQCGIERPMIQQAVEAAISSDKLRFRPGAAELIHTLQAAEVPTLIFSAGLADVIDEAVVGFLLLDDGNGGEGGDDDSTSSTRGGSRRWARQNNKMDPMSGEATVPATAAAAAAPASEGLRGAERLAPTTQIFGNRMRWEKEAQAPRSIGLDIWDGPGGEVERLVDFSALVHMYNKNMHAVPHDMQPRRRNAIVIGDGLGDAAMVDGARHAPAATLKVGLLNHTAKVAEHLPQYEEAFDIVLLGDGDLEPLNDIIALILGTLQQTRSKDDDETAAVTTTTTTTTTTTERRGIGRTLTNLAESLKMKAHPRANQPAAAAAGAGVGTPTTSVLSLLEALAAQGVAATSAVMRFLEHECTGQRLVAVRGGAGGGGGDYGVGGKGNTGGAVSSSEEKGNDGVIGVSGGDWWRRSDGGGGPGEVYCDAGLSVKGHFLRLARREQAAMERRDAEDASKLLEGVQLAVAAGVLPKLPPPHKRPPYQPVEVVGKTPKQVAAVIVDAIGAENAARGCVVVICGLSGTGKGTTVAEIVSQIPNGVAWSNGNVFRCLTLLALAWQRQHAEKKRADWLSKQQMAAPLSSASSKSSSSSSSSKSKSSSLSKKGGTKKKPQQGRSKQPAPNSPDQRAKATTHRGEENSTTTILEAAALTHENIDMFMGMLEFGRFFPSNSAQQAADAAPAAASSSTPSPSPSSSAASAPAVTTGGAGAGVGAGGAGASTGWFDVRINGLGLDELCSDIEHTELKSPAVAANVPAVARASQGHVVKFAAAAVAMMAAADNGKGKGNRSKGNGGGGKKCSGGGGGGGCCVVMEGRQATVDYVQSPHRFELTAAGPPLSLDGDDYYSSGGGSGSGGSGGDGGDDGDGGVLLLGKRRAAQCIAAAATKQLAEAQQQGSGHHGGAGDGAVTAECAVKAALLRLSTTTG